MPSYRFELGDSRGGQVGFCVSMRASSGEEALQHLLDAYSGDEVVLLDHTDHLEDGVTYHNFDSVTVDNIYLVEDDQPDNDENDKKEI